MSQLRLHSGPQRRTSPHTVITRLVDQFCAQRLTREHADICNRLVATYHRACPSAFEAGPAEAWAGRLLYTLARVNYLFDTSQTPHLGVADICLRFGITQDDAMASSTEIMELLDVLPMDPEWCVPRRMADGITGWLITVRGIPLDARWVPRELQEEAFRLGLIPYVPKPGEFHPPRRLL